MNMRCQCLMPSNITPHAVELRRAKVRCANRDKLAAVGRMACADLAKFDHPVPIEPRAIFVVDCRPALRTRHRLASAGRPVGHNIDRVRQPALPFRRISAIVAGSAGGKEFVADRIEILQSVADLSIKVGRIAHPDMRFEEVEKADISLQLLGIEEVARKGIRKIEVGRRWTQRLDRALLISTET